MTINYYFNKIVGILLGIGTVLLCVLEGMTGVMTLFAIASIVIFAKAILSMLKGGIADHIIATIFLVILFIFGFSHPLTLFGYTFRSIISAFIYSIIPALIISMDVEYSDNHESFTLLCVTALVLFSLFSYRVMLNDSIFFENTKYSSVDERIGHQKYDSITFDDVILDALEEMKAENKTKFIVVDLNNAIRDKEYFSSRRIRFTIVKRDYEYPDYLRISLEERPKYHFFKPNPYEVKGYYVNPETLEVFDLDWNRITK